MNEVAGVLLDVGGVLLLPNADAIASRLVRWGARPTGHDDAKVHYRSVAAFDLTGDLSEDRREYCRLLGVRESEVAGVAEHEAFHRPWTVVPSGPVGALRALCDAGVVLVVVSDSDGTVEAQLEAAGVAQVGQGLGATLVGVCDSAHIGARKPDPVMFSAALESGKLSARDAVMVGDSMRCDVAGATACGIRAFHVDPLRLCNLVDHPHIPGAQVLADIFLSEHHSG